MIIPVKCYTCGKVLANKYEYYIEQVRARKMGANQQVDAVTYLTVEKANKTPEGLVMDDLGLNKVCCRRHMLTHVDIE
tara:strand:- start:112 stop:345 length:234 start_codon:yes stop_codon:yes gene_type:complete